MRKLTLLDRILLSRPKPKDWKSELAPECHAQVKLDGFRMTLVVDDCGVRAFGRKEHIDLWPSIAFTKGVEAATALPRGTIIDGELHAASDGTSTDVSTLIKEESHELRFTAFAVPVLAGIPRLEMTPELSLNQLNALGFETPAVVRFPEGTLTSEVMKTALEHNVEGYVFKLLQWSSWFRVKRAHTVDCVVMSVESGKGKYAGMIGALRVGLFNERGKLTYLTNVGSGLSDADREKIISEVCGSVVEVCYDSLGAKGKLRFPRLLRWRTDKSPADCRISQLK